MMIDIPYELKSIKVDLRPDKNDLSKEFYIKHGDINFTLLHSPPYIGYLLHLIRNYYYNHSVFDISIKKYRVGEFTSSPTWHLDGRLSYKRPTSNIMFVAGESCTEFIKEIFYIKNYFDNLKEIGDAAAKYVKKDNIKAINPYTFYLYSNFALHRGVPAKDETRILLRIFAGPGLKPRNIYGKYPH